MAAPSGPYLGSSSTRCIELCLRSSRRIRVYQMFQLSSSKRGTLEASSEPGFDVSGFSLDTVMFVMIDESRSGRYGII